MTVSKLRFWILSALIIAIAIFSTIKYQENPYQTASKTFRGRVLGFEIFHIPSNSMQPTLMPSDHVFVSTRAYQSQKPSINDIIIFLYPKNRERNYVKRLIASGGDTVHIENFNIYVNDKVINQTYLNKKLVIKPFSRFMQKIIIPEGKLFVLGDNRDNSNDSRFFGLVDTSDVIGKAKTVLWGDQGRFWKTIK